MENDVYSQTLRPQELGLHLFRGPRLRVRRYSYIVREPCPITMYTNDLNSLLDRTTSYKWLSDRVPLEVTPAVPQRLYAVSHDHSSTKGHTACHLRSVHLERDVASTPSTLREGTRTVERWGRRDYENHTNSLFDKGKR